MPLFCAFQRYLSINPWLQNMTNVQEESKWLLSPVDAKPRIPAEHWNPLHWCCTPHHTYYFACSDELRRKSCCSPGGIESPWKRAHELSSLQWQLRLQSDSAVPSLRPLTRLVLILPYQGCMEIWRGLHGREHTIIDTEWQRILSPVTSEAMGPPTSWAR